MEGGEDALIKCHKITQVGWPCSAMAPGQLPWCGAGSKGQGSFPRSPPNLLGYPSQPCGMGAGEEGNRNLCTVCCIFQGILGPLAFNFIKIPDIWTRSMAD